MPRERNRGVHLEHVRRRGDSPWGGGRVGERVTVFQELHEHGCFARRIIDDSIVDQGVDHDERADGRGDGWACKDFRGRVLRQDDAGQ